MYNGEKVLSSWKKETMKLNLKYCVMSLVKTIQHEL